MIDVHLLFSGATFLLCASLEGHAEAVKVLLAAPGIDTREPSIRADD